LSGSVAPRAAAQGLMTLLTYGVGMFAGSWLSGAVVEKYTLPIGHNWRAIWSVAAAFAVVVLVLFSAKFRNEENCERVDVSHAPGELPL
jgi:MFS family permease